MRAPSINSETRAPQKGETIVWNANEKKKNKITEQKHTMKIVQTDLSPTPNVSTLPLRIEANQKQLEENEWNINRRWMKR